MDIKYLRHEDSRIRQLWAKTLPEYNHYSGRTWSACYGGCGRQWVELGRDEERHSFYLHALSWNKGMLYTSCGFCGKVHSTRDTPRAVEAYSNVEILKRCREVNFCKDKVCYHCPHRFRCLTVARE